MHVGKPKYISFDPIELLMMTALMIVLGVGPRRPQYGKDHEVHLRWYHGQLCQRDGGHQAAAR